MSLETEVAARLHEAALLVEEAGMEQERRSLRLAVKELDWSREPEGIVIRFRLTRGSFATTVIREIFEVGAGGAEAEE